MMSIKPMLSIALLLVGCGGHPLEDPDRVPLTSEQAEWVRECAIHQDAFSSRDLVYHCEERARLLFPPETP